MLAWMGYAMLASAALGVTAWLIGFAVDVDDDKLRLAMRVGAARTISAPAAVA